MIEVCKAGLEQLAAIIEIEDRSFTEPWSHKSMEEALQNDSILTLAAVEAGQVLGYAMLARLGIEGEIYNIAVHPDARRRGVGAKLLEATLAFSRADGQENVFLEVRDSNAAAQALYTGHGFVPVGRRKNYYTNPTEDAILMAYTVNKEESQ